MQIFDHLTVLRDGTIAAYLERSKGKILLHYMPNTAYPLSLSLPLDGNYPKKNPQKWVRSLLPENSDNLNALAEHLHLPDRSLWSLLHSVGGDLPGNVSIVPPDWAPHYRSEGASVSPAQIASAILEIKMVHPPKRYVALNDHLSIGGMRPKFALTLEQGIWSKSSMLCPSTHIFKPGQVLDIEEVEAAALNLANRIGIPAARSSVATFDNEKTYLTERFDRDTSKGFPAHRLYQEDLGQVLGLSKFDATKTSIKGIADVLYKADMPPSEIYIFVTQMAFNVHVGNTDAHGKNYSVTYDREGRLRMTPLYDCVPALGFRNGEVSTRGLAMTVNGKSDPFNVTLDDWFSWSIANHLDAYTVQRIVKEVVIGIRKNAEQVFGEFNVPEVHIMGVLAANRGIQV